jgi:hypothetical protein
MYEHRWIARGSLLIGLTLAFIVSARIALSQEPDPEPTPSPAPESPSPEATTEEAPEADPPPSEGEASTTSAGTAAESGAPPDACDIASVVCDPPPVEECLPPMMTTQADLAPPDLCPPPPPPPLECPLSTTSTSNFAPPEVPCAPEDVEEIWDLDHPCNIIVTVPAGRPIAMADGTYECPTPHKRMHVKVWIEVFTPEYGYQEVATETYSTGDFPSKFVAGPVVGNVCIPNAIVTKALATGWWVDRFGHEHGTRTDESLPAPVGLCPGPFERLL